ncbi:hypothetical protein CPB84DRAFT_1767607 [Gymnopilus junonius]|uniref:Uncharacterized protein n=1 Tax=Gymnopilus junonius TaxID=109634 RepID=A0A9P5TRZ4_GYMJU|nr:hypothetical protein CPB84DRAFT_1767607 [Gymnopilus junonius]
MFGESESESPRVPSPWDSLISIPPSPVPFGGQRRTHTPSPLAAEFIDIPRLVPEADDGNVEYKLQLLNPSPARFARLVTQMKWRLLEGGGQAYYELGVADSGELIGLPREELEQSLETLEMMAGEIGASIIVVKEIEVPAVMASLVKRSGEWAGRGSKRMVDGSREGTSSSLEGGYLTVGNSETDLDSMSGMEIDSEDLAVTIVLDNASSRDPDLQNPSDLSVFSMDPDTEDSSSAVDDEQPQPRFSIDLEISSVYKPRPFRARVPNHPHYAHSTGGKNKRVKKHKHLNMLNSSHGNGYVHHSSSNGPSDMPSEENKALTRRQARDRRREERRKTLEAKTVQAVESKADLSPQDTLKFLPTAAAGNCNNDADTLIVGLESLHVQLLKEPAQILDVTDLAILDMANVQDFQDLEDDDDVFAPPVTPSAPYHSFSAASKFSVQTESHLDVDTDAIGIVSALEGSSDGGGEGVGQPRLIVEALVVRKMSLEEAFLDFGGFSLT